jgi:hypothetical protein
MIKNFLGLIALQVVFAGILAGAIFMGQKADAKCAHPKIEKPVIPWAPARTCGR